MPYIKPASHMASRVVGALSICLCLACTSRPDANKDRKKAAKNLAQEVERAQFHKVYIADFLDPAGARTEKGCFFASTFSTNLADSHNFEVVNRIQAQKQLNELGISAHDLLQPEMLSKAARALGADGILAGTATITAKDANLVLSLREASSGKEVHSVDYHEKLNPAFEAGFPAAEANSTHVYYFPGLDGVSQPKCIYCPNPDYTDEERQARIEGSVMMSVTVGEKGTIIDARVETNPYDSLTRKTVNILKKWRMEPSRDLEGNPVAVRTSVETVFRMLN